MEMESAQCQIKFSQPSGEALLMMFSGDWTLGGAIPQGENFDKLFESHPGVRRVLFDTKGLKAWDTSLLTFVTNVFNQCTQRNVQVDKKGLPHGVQKLIELATAVPEKKDTGKKEVRDSFVAKVGSDVIAFGRSAAELMAFIGEDLVTTGRFLTGKARFRWSEVGIFLQDCGAQALPIVSLITLLVGMILGFVGIVQLKMFGAEVYVANLVGIAMVRTLGAVMTGIIMAGRTGGAFAAQLGTMEVNEEIDALRTLGVNPMEFLVLPRMLALMVMMPLLCLYADLMGILGGMIVSVGFYGLNGTMYIQRTNAAVGVDDLFIGLFMSAVFGYLVAMAGCLRGMQCGRSASAVGDAATSAVVTSIVAIVIATATITILCDVIGI
ncbi:ABC transporter permease [bacterium]|nr:ABC transporter permease [bacterium]